MYSNTVASYPKPIVTCCSVVPPEKITCKPVMRQKTCNYNVLFGSSTRYQAWSIYQRTFR